MKKNNHLNNRQIEIVSNYLKLSMGKKIDKNFICFTAEIQEVLDILSELSIDNI